MLLRAWQGAAGLDVKVFAVKPVSDLKGDAAQAAQKCLESGIRIETIIGKDIALPECHIIVDALLGTGLNKQVKGNMAAVIEAINQHTGKVLSIDIPSGLNADTGKVMGAAVKANVTITFIGAKAWGVYGRWA